MIKYLSNQDINKPKWDQCIATAFNGLIYSYSWYLDAVCDNWDALVFDDYKAVMPLPWKKKYGIKYLYTPFFMQQLGVFSKTEPDLELLKSFLSAIPSQFKYINLFFNAGNSNLAGLAHVLSRPNYILNLNKSYLDLAANYKTNCKRNLKKAQKNQLIIEETTPAKVIELYRNYYRHVSSSCSQSDYQRFEMLSNSLLKSGNTEVVAVKDKGILCAAALFFKYDSKIYYMMGASTEAGKQNGCFHFLMDHVIKKYADSSYIIDFEGSIIPSLAYFYQQFGAVKTPYFHYHQNRLPQLLRWLKR
jgi:hypothetical protein